MRRPLRPSPTARPGFTLVELLVAAALCVVIMAILATAFSVGMDTLSELKTVVGLSEQLRSAEDVLGRDLEAPHLEIGEGVVVRVSDPLVQANAWDSNSAAVPGARGYFFIRQDTQGTAEGSDTDGVSSSRAVDHKLAFTVRLPGGTSQEAFFGRIEATTSRFANLRNLSLRDLDPKGEQFVGRWAEVAYFLRPGPLMTVSDDPTKQLRVHTLHRRQRVLAPSPVTVAFGGSNYYELREDFPEVSFATVETPTGSPATADVNTPESITNRRKRLGFIKDWRGGGTYVTPINTTTTGSPSQADFIPAGYHERQPPTVAFDPNAQVYGSDVLMNNVLSMRVQVIANNNTQFGDLVQPAPATPTWPQVYDTAAAPGSVDAAAVTSAGIQKARIKAIRIVIRAYDVKNQATRQITITRDL